MTPGPGTKIGGYEITGALGAGGMGEVYRARDTKLQRDVAIKVLPEQFSTDSDRLSRFEREAQSLAALNHPNIAQVFGVIENPPALAMELVEGEDLSQRIARGAIPLDEALPIAKQIADALEAAHDRGIVHRDLKPANIKVRDDGTVKVLDFGLAKAMTAVVQGSSPADTGSPKGLDYDRNSPTFTSPAMTGLGVILGTAAYMAPEQAKGKPVDKRADIWAFGCLVFEMLTGRAIFAHDSVAETLGAVVARDPVWTALPPETPEWLRYLLRRCLERDPRTRLRDIGEARVLLSGGGFAEFTGPAAAAARRLRLLQALGFIALGAVAGAGLLQFLPARAADATTVSPFSLRRLTELPGPELQPDISPDGRQIVFASAAAGNLDVYLLRVGGARPLNLTASSPGDDQQASLSPNGEQIAFRSERDGGGIYVMGATGESVRRVIGAGFDPAWSPDGRALAYATEPVIDPYARYGASQLWTVDIASGKAVRLETADAVQPAWSPDGGRIAYWANTGGQRDLWTVAARGGTPLPVTQDAATDWSPEWSADGRWLYFSSDRGGNMNIWRVAIDQRTGAARGDPEPVTTSLTAVGHPRFGSDPRRAVVVAYSTTHELLRTRVGDARPASGEPFALRSSSLGWCSPSPSADWLACTSRTAQEDIVLMRPDGSETIRLTDDAAKDRNPSWSPDGSRIAFMSTRTGRWELWSIRRDGSDLRPLTDLLTELHGTAWSPDGSRVITAVATASPPGAWIFDASTLATPKTATFFKNPGATRFSAEAWSPDGSMVAGSILNGSGFPRQPAIWEVASGKVRTIEVPPPLANLAEGTAGWLRDSRRFLFASGRGLVVVDALTGKWVPFDAPENGIRYRLSADGRTLYSERDILDSDIWLLEAAR